MTEAEFDPASLPSVLPQLSGLIKPFIDKNSTPYNFICVIFSNPGTGIRLQFDLFKFIEKNPTVTAHWCDPNDNNENLSRYRINRFPICIVFHKGAETRRFTGPELEGLIPFLEANKPKPQFVGAARRLDGPATQIPPSVQPVKLPPMCTKRRLDGQVPSPTDKPQTGSKLPPLFKQHQSVTQKNSNLNTPPVFQKHDPLNLPATTQKHQPPVTVYTKPDPPWAYFPRKLKADFQQTATQLELKRTLLELEFKERDVDFALQETNSNDFETVSAWIEDYHNEGELWSEVDWILAGKPSPEPPHVAKPKAVLPVKKVEPPLQKVIEPTTVLIRFKFSGKTVDHAFQPTQTLPDVIAKLKQSDVDPTATITLFGPTGSPLTDPTQTLTSLGLHGRVALTVHLT